MNRAFLLLFFFLSFPLPAEELKLSFVGDIMAHDVNFNRGNFDKVYEGVKKIFLEDDLTFGNLEFPVVNTLPYSTYPRFNVRREYVEAVIQAGVDVLSLANNHTADKGTEEILDTLGSLLMLREQYPHIRFSGIRGNLDVEFRPVEIEVKGVSIGFLAVTEFSNVYPSKNYMHLVDYKQTEPRKTFLEYIKKTAPVYDLFIISYHAGREYRYEPGENKKEWFRQLIDAGVDIVYGHHPHVLQPYEILEKDHQHKLIIYSAGNFISGQRWFYSPPPPEHYRSYTGDSAIYRVTLEMDSNGTGGISVKPLLIANHITNDHQVIVLPYDTLLTLPLSPEWREYYKKREKLMQKFVLETTILKKEERLVEN